MCFFSFFRIKGLYCFYGLFSFCFWGGVVGLFCWYGSWSFVVLLWVAAGWNGWYFLCQKDFLFCRYSAVLCVHCWNLPTIADHEKMAGRGVLFCKGKDRCVLIWEYILFGRVFNLCILCGCYFFLYMVSVSVFFFLLWAGLWCVRGRPVGVGVWKKSAGDVCLRRSRGRLPTLPLAQYHRRDQV